MLTADTHMHEHLKISSAFAQDSRKISACFLCVGDCGHMCLGWCAERLYWHVCVMLL